MKMWSGRFRQPLDPAFEPGSDRSSSIAGCSSASWRPVPRTRARLRKRACFPRTNCVTMLQGLEQIGEKAADSPEFLDDTEAEDVHHFVEKQLGRARLANWLQAAQRTQPQRADCDRPAAYPCAACDEISGRALAN